MTLICVAQWWMNYGESAPNLRRIAIKILSQTTSSSSCERNWSSFALIHTKQRNRMKQKKVERNVFIHYNVRLRLKNMKSARNQGEREEYCPINLDYIFAEDDPLLPWLENREKEIDAINSEEENYQNDNRTTRQTHQETIIEVEENSSSATHTDYGSGSDGDSGPELGSGGVRGMNETVVPSTYPYPHPSQSQDSQPMTSEDRGKSPFIEEEAEEEEEGEEEEEEEESSRMGSMERQSPWPSGNPNVYTQQSFYPYYPPQPPQPGIDSYAYLFGYPPQYGYGYGHLSNINNDDDNVEEPPRHSFWW